MATKALWTTCSPDRLEWERPTSAETQGSKPTCVLPVASKIGPAFQKRELACVTSATELFVPLALLTPLWETHPKEMTPAPSPMLQKRHLQTFSKRRNEATYISLKGLGHLNTKGWGIMSWDIMSCLVEHADVCHVCMDVCSVSSSGTRESRGCLSHEAASGGNKFRSEKHLEQCPVHRKLH